MFSYFRCLAIQNDLISFQLPIINRLKRALLSTGIDFIVQPKLNA